MQLNLEQVGGVNYTANELEYAKKIQSSFTYTVPDIAQAKQIKPLRNTITAGGGSTDVGDVSYVVPTVGMGAATWVPGTPAHSWQAVSCGGTSIGSKGMMVAAKTLAATAVDLLLQPATLEQAKKEHIQSVGSYQYKALLGDRTPALNYRDSQ
jgi:aminobenzoyl-glutamate utilization protein B